MDESHKQNTEQKNPKAKKCISYDPIYINFRSRQDKSMVVDTAYPWGRGAAVSGRNSFSEMVVYYFLIW